MSVSLTGRGLTVIVPKGFKCAHDLPVSLAQMRREGRNHGTDRHQATKSEIRRQGLSGSRRRRAVSWKSCPAVRKSGGYAYRLAIKQEKVTLGGYPTYSLAEARTWRDDCKATGRAWFIPDGLEAWRSDSRGMLLPPSKNWRRPSFAIGA